MSSSWQEPVSTETNKTKEQKIKSSELADLGLLAQNALAVQDQPGNFTKSCLKTKTAQVSGDTGFVLT